MPLVSMDLTGRLGCYQLIERTAGLMKVSAIYAIIHKSTGKVYIGSTVSLKTRISCHRCELRKGKHDNSYLQHAWNKYGESDFEFAIVERCDPSVLSQREEYWMAQSECCDKSKGFNLDIIVIHKLHSDETKDKIRKAHIGRKFSDEHRANLSKSRIGIKFPPRTPEQRANHARAQLGKKLSEETKRKISQRHTGRIITPEWKERARQGWLRAFKEKRDRLERCQQLLSI